MYFSCCTPAAVYLNTFLKWNCDILSSVRVILLLSLYCYYMCVFLHLPVLFCIICAGARLYCLAGISIHTAGGQATQHLINLIRLYYTLMSVMSYPGVLRRVYFPQVEWKSLLRSRCGNIGGWGGEGIDKNLFQKMISTYYLLWCSPIFLRTLPSLPSALYEIIDAHIVMSNHSRSADCWYLSWLRRVVCIL
jgi:hypothetical protein